MRDGKSNIQKTRILFSALIAATVFGIAILNREKLLTTLKNVRLEWITLGFVLYLLVYVIRAQRLRTLSEGRVDLWPEGIYCASLHGFATYMLPLRTGDLTLPVFLKSISRIDMPQGLTILYKARLLDIFTLGIWTFLAAIIPYWVVPNYARGALFLAGSMMICAPFLMRKILLISAPFNGPVGKLLRKLGRVGTMRLTEIVQSVGIWASLGACFYCIAEAIGLSLQLGAVWLLIVIQMPLQLIPLQGLANSGNHEGGWVAGLMLLGFSAAVALEFALMSHAVLLLYVLAMGPVAMISGALYRSQKTE